MNEDWQKKNSLPSRGRADDVTLLQMKIKKFELNEANRGGMKTTYLIKEHENNENETATKCKQLEKIDCKSVSCASTSKNDQDVDSSSKTNLNNEHLGHVKFKLFKNRDSSKTDQAQKTVEMQTKRQYFNSETLNTKDQYVRDDKISRQNSIISQSDGESSQKNNEFNCGAEQTVKEKANVFKNNVTHSRNQKPMGIFGISFNSVKHSDKKIKPHIEQNESQNDCPQVNVRATDDKHNTSKDQNVSPDSKKGFFSRILHNHSLNHKPEPQQAPNKKDEHVKPDLKKDKETVSNNSSPKAFHHMRWGLLHKNKKQNETPHNLMHMGAAFRNKLKKEEAKEHLAQQKLKADQSYGNESKNSKQTIIYPSENKQQNSNKTNEPQQCDNTLNLNNKPSEKTNVYSFSNKKNASTFENSGIPSHYKSSDQKHAHFAMASTEHTKPQNQISDVKTNDSSSTEQNLNNSKRTDVTITVDNVEDNEQDEDKPLNRTAFGANRASFKKKFGVSSRDARFFDQKSLVEFFSSRSAGDTNLYGSQPSRGTHGPKTITSIKRKTPKKNENQVESLEKPDSKPNESNERKYSNAEKLSELENNSLDIKQNTATKPEVKSENSTSVRTNIKQKELPTEIKNTNKTPQKTTQVENYNPVKEMHKKFDSLVSGGARSKFSHQAPIINNEKKLKGVEKKSVIDDNLNLNRHGLDREKNEKVPKTFNDSKSKDSGFIANTFENKTILEDKKQQKPELTEVTVEKVNNGNSRLPASAAAPKLKRQFGSSGEASSSSLSSALGVNGGEGGDGDKELLLALGHSLHPGICFYKVRCLVKDTENMTSKDKVKVDESEPFGGEEAPFEARDVVVRNDRWVTDLYAVDSLLGKGKFGEVKKCSERITGRQLAAKFIEVTGPEDRKDVINEVEIMTNLQHPRLLQLYDAFEKKDRFCLVMELINGGELFERIINDDFILTEKACVMFMRQICDGVAFMHSQSVLHLDMKPENILCLTREGNRIKIIDFGLARKYNPKVDMRVLFGTPEFVAPEVVNFDPISPATDLWSVGVICYVLLSGLSPFMGDSEQETLSNVTFATWDFNAEEFESISGEAKDFISRLLVKDGRKRMKAAECLEHQWLRRSTKRESRVPERSLSKKRLRKFVYRRKWQKAINAMLALRRMGVAIS